MKKILCLSWLLLLFSCNEKVQAEHSIARSPLLTLTSSSPIHLLTQGSVAQELMPQDVGTLTLTRSFTAGGATLQLKVGTLLYHQGSFRQIEAIHYQDFRLIDSPVPMRLDSYALSVWPETDLPSTRLLYSVSGTLIAKLSGAQRDKLGPELVALGFQESGRSSNQTYYRLLFNQNDSIDLYARK